MSIYRSSLILRVIGNLIHVVVLYLLSPAARIFSEFWPILYKSMQLFRVDKLAFQFLIILRLNF